jgi:hypothetical protein
MHGLLPALGSNALYMDDGLRMVESLLVAQKPNVVRLNWHAVGEADHIDISVEGLRLRHATGHALKSREL